MHEVIKIIYGWVESASIGLKLATVCLLQVQKVVQNYSIPRYLLGVIQVVMYSISCY